jgi:hypothetical protein
LDEYGLIAGAYNMASGIININAKLMRKRRAPAALDRVFYEFNPNTNAEGITCIWRCPDVAFDPVKMEPVVEPDLVTAH